MFLRDAVGDEVIVFSDIGTNDIGTHFLVDRVTQVAQVKPS